MDNFREVSFSTVFDRPKNYFSELLHNWSDSPCERHFLAPGVVRREGQKRVKICHFQLPPLPSPQRKASNLHREIISHQRFDAVTYLEQNTNLDLFWNTLGLNGFRKGQKLSISLIMTHKSYKFARLDNFT